ncbi:hypothetical protein C0J52_05472 [Blattella germanica]|nr:hypothetical protein C0J52_05472 [Blattella germanica]
MSLTQLSANTVKLITSTQIITSVSSAIKELIENSIDAGATNIDVKIENNGLDLIEVKDDGCGIKKADTSNMALPSYTSKISEYSDLFKLQSYGFRGEALNALCRVADVSITTKTDEDEFAMVYMLNNDGNIISSKPSHLGKGTLVTVKGLFHNVPVRKQFLSSGRRANEELKRADSVVKSLAVIHPHLRVTFCHNKCRLWQKSTCLNLRQSVMQLISHAIASKLEELSLDESELNIKMLVPKKDIDSLASICQSNNECMMNYINSRPVRYKKLEKMMLKYLSERFPGQLPMHKYPHYLVSIVTSPSEMDVNLEPNKTKVLLKEEDDVLSKIENLLATYYQVPKQVNGDCEKSNSDETLSAAITSSYIEEDSFNTSESVDEGIPLTCKRMKMDKTGTNSSVDKNLSSIAQNVAVQMSARGRELFLNDETSQSSIVGLSCNKSDENVHQRPYEATRVCGETNASLLEKSGWTVINVNGRNNGPDSDMANISRNNSLVENIRTSQSAVSGTSNYFGSTRMGGGENCTFQQNKHCDGEVEIFEPSVNTTTKVQNNCNDTIKNAIDMTEDVRNFGDEAINERGTDQVVLSKENGIENSNASNSEIELISCNEVQVLNYSEDVMVDPQPQKNDCEDLFEAADLAMEKWSKGFLKAQNGNPLQGSSVLLPKPVGESLNLSYQSVSSQMGQKEKSAFTKFSRDEQPKILKEFPGISFTRVAELLADRWRSLSEEDRMNYEELAKEVAEMRNSKKIEEGLQRLDAFINIVSKTKNQPTKKNFTKKGSPNRKSPKQVNKEIKMESLNETHVEKKPWKRPCRKKKVLEISMQDLKNAALEPIKSRSVYQGVTLIGQNKSSGEWLYRKEQELGIVRHWGLQEVVLFHRLMADHTIPLKKLDSKILVDERYLGPDLMAVLLSLNKAYDVMAQAVIIRSEVISKNGFKIEVLEGRSSCMLTEVASTINFYGVNDLKELLRLIKDHGTSSLEKCRTLRVIGYIRNMTPDEILKILDELSEEEALDSGESEEEEEAIAESDHNTNSEQDNLSDEDESENSGPKDSFFFFFW